MALNLWSRVTGMIVGLGVGQAASRAVQPIFELVGQDSWSANPNRVLPIDTLAELVAKAIVGEGQAAEHAKRTGYDSNKLRALIQLALHAPPVAEAMQMRRRGTITPAQLEHSLRKAGIEPQYDAAIADLLNVLPTVTDMVRFGVREVYDPGQRAALDLDAEFPPAFAADAAKIGLSRETAGDYWAAHWELPSYTQGTEMLFRGEITPAQFDGLLKALDYAPTWRNPLQAIARRIPTITDMIRFAVREVYDPAARRDLGIDSDYPTAFTAQAAKHGMAEGDARDYWAAHWRLPSARQGYQMLWRGIIQLPQLQQLLKALDYPAVWRDRLVDIAYIVPGRVDLRRMFRADVITQAEVLAGYGRIGYAPADAQTLTDFAIAEKESHAAGPNLISKYRGTVVTRAHKEFLEQSLDEVDARALLSQLGIPAKTIDGVMPLWTIERDLFRRELTPTQVKKAYAAGRITFAQALERLKDAGYLDEDAIHFLES